jgi:hypothetical protein
MVRKSKAVILLTALVFSSANLGAWPPAGSSATTDASVAGGTRFLVRLEDKLSTKKHQAGKKFKVKTLEALAAPDGSVLPPGAVIRGHVSRIEQAGFTGRARLWLSFDEIRTRSGTLPIVASVASVPGEHSVRAGDSREGEIESRTSKGRREIEAAAIGAAMGAAAGATARGGRGAAIGAAVGAAAGFLIASGITQEIELDKGAKIELQLDRPLYLASR